MKLYLKFQYIEQKTGRFSHVDKSGGPGVQSPKQLVSHLQRVPELWGLQFENN